MTIEQCRQFFYAARSLFEEHLDELSRLDSVLGDGDHGASMLKGFRAMAERVETGEYSDISGMFMDAGMTFLRVVGGTCGPLFANLFLKGAAEFRGKDKLDIGDIAAMYLAADQAVQTMGRSKPGEKTMVDALHPAALSLKQSAEDKISLSEALSLALAAAEKGTGDTENMLAVKGRGRYQGENSLGAKDPGAVSVCIIVEAFKAANSLLE